MTTTAESVADQILELRQYTLLPGRRDTLVELFDRELIDSQEAEGMEIIGQYRDAARADRFVWLRGYPSMAQRQKSLSAFYSGATWKRHAAAANATMVDIDDVLLLRPMSDATRFGPLPPRAPQIATAPAATIAVTVWPVLERLALPRFIASITGLLSQATTVVGLFVTEPSENNFPALPVRSDANVAVAFHRIIDDDDHLARKAFDQLVAATGCELGPPHELALEPTPRSRLR